MNKILYYFFPIGCFICMTISSCNKDVSLSPVTFQSTTVLTTEAQSVTQLAGIYNVLERDPLYGQGLWCYFEGGADEMFRYTGVNNIYPEVYNVQSSYAPYLSLWGSLYEGVESANILLNQIDAIPMDSAKRTNIKGQAIFLRAYYLYILTSRFGDIPLKTVLTSSMGTNFNLPKTPQKDVYNFILSEMTKAADMVQPIYKPQSWQTVGNLPTANIVSQSTVWAILARVCLAMAGQPVNDASKYTDALNWSLKVINSNIHSLNSAPVAIVSSSGLTNTPAYSRLFINNMQNNLNDPNGNTTEGIWDASFLSKSNQTGAFANTNFLITQQLGNLMGILNPDASSNSVNGYSNGLYRPFHRMFYLFAVGDQRRDWAISNYIYTTAGGNVRQPHLQVNITGGNGKGAIAIANVSSTNNIVSVSVENGGSGYTSVPAISFTSYVGSGATATAVIKNGQVVAINMVKQGSAYPTIYEHQVGKWRREYEINLPTVRLQSYTSCNFPIIRYADVLLMAAEAGLQTGNISSTIEYYNQVRRRAFGYPPSIPVPGFDATSITMQDIMDERSRELCFEGVRRMDLIRWGVMTATMQSLNADNLAYAPTAGNSITGNVNSSAMSNLASSNFLLNPIRNVLFPIPASELISDKSLTQNPGW